MSNILRYRLEQDFDARNPRTEFDNFGTLIACHKRYTLSDEDAKPAWLEHDERHGYYYREEYDPRAHERVRTVKHISSWDDIEAELSRDIKDEGDEIAVLLPVYLYDHSGITIRTTPFSCPWDSGRVGLIYVTKAQVREAFGVKRISAKTLERARQGLEGEVGEFNQYLTGDVYGYIVERVPLDEDGFEQDDEAEELDSCWGFYGHDYATSEAQSVLEYHQGRAA